MTNRTLSIKTSGDLEKYNFIPKDSVDVVLIGSSKIMLGIQPIILYKEKAIVSYNYGSSNQSIPTTYYLLRDVFEKQNPKVVVICASGLLEEKFSNDSWVHAVVDNMPITSVSRLEMLLDFYGNSLKLLEFYVPMLAYHSRWSELNQSDFLNIYDYSKLNGGRIWEAMTNVRNIEGNVSNYAMPDTILKYMELIQQLCADNNCELLVINMLIRYDDDYDSKDYMMSQYA